MKTNSKLSLKKERIAHLTNSEMRSVIGGASTQHGFTCSWCMGVKVSVEYKGVKVSASTK